MTEQKIYAQGILKRNTQKKPNWILFLGKFA